MTKILIWVVVIVAVLFGLRLLNVAKAKHRPDGSNGASPRQPAEEPMVRCVRCGVYLPRADATQGAVGMTCGDPNCTKPTTRDS